MYKITLISFLLTISVLVIVTVNSQGLTGRNYMEKQLLCALEKGPCDLLGTQIKDALPEIIGNNCASCDPRQKSNARRMASIIRERYPEVWRALVEKYSKQK